MNNKPITGPYRVTEDGDDLVIEATNKAVRDARYIAVIEPRGIPDKARREATAKLLAASPNLAAALMGMLAYGDSEFATNKDAAQEAARAALKLAGLTDEHGVTTSPL